MKVIIARWLIDHGFGFVGWRLLHPDRLTRRTHQLLAEPITPNDDAAFRDEWSRL